MTTPNDGEPGHEPPSPSGSDPDSANPSGAPADPPAKPPPSVVQLVEQRTGGKARILLRDSDSLGESSPIVDPKSPETVQFPAARHQYQILGEIARGGMGVVLKAQDKELGREVAIKVLDERFSGQESVLQRFVEEAQIGGQLQHPGVVPVYELGMLDDERPFIAMKLVKGRTLSALLSDRRTLGEGRRRFLTIFESVCQTVAYAHSKGVIHRDLKPANIMVGAFGEVQVGDWGLAKVVGQGGIEDEERARRTQMTVIETVRSGPGSSGSASVVGSVLGTPAYMPPEQALGEIEKVDERSDVFSLGGILCEILTGDPPYLGTERERTVVMAAHARLDTARERIEASDADAELKALALECLAPARVVRPRNAGEVANRIHDHFSASDERARAAELEAAEAQVKVAAARRARLLTVGLAAAVVLAVVSVGVTLRSRALAQLEQTSEVRRQLDADVAQVLGFQRDERYDAALELALGAQASIEASPWADEELRQRAAELVGDTEGLVTAEAERQAREARNGRLVAELESTRMDLLELSLESREAEAAERFQGVFEAHGLPLDLEEPEAALEMLRDTGIEVEIAAGLDDWAWAQRAVTGWNSPEAERLTALALDLDADPDRAEIRFAILAGDGTRLTQLAEETVERGLSATDLFSIFRALWTLNRNTGRQLAQRIEAWDFPDSFELNYVVSMGFRNQERHDAALPFLSRLVTLRPESGKVRLQYGISLAIAGELVRGIDQMEVARGLGAEPTTVDYRQGLVYWELGEYAAAERALAAVVARNPLSRAFGFDHHCSRYLSGQIDRDELESGFAALRQPEMGEYIAISQALLDHPRAELEDVERALELAREAFQLGQTDAYLWAVECEALTTLGLADEALERLVAWERDDVLKSGIYDTQRTLMRARCHWQLGEKDIARMELETGRRETNWATRSAPERWERSRLMRLLRQAESTLAR